MARRLPGLLDTLRSRRAVARWEAAAAEGHRLDTATLAALAPRARDVAGLAARLVREADARLTQAAHPVARPPQADWAWRPAPWSGALIPTARAGVPGGTALVDGVTLFHDCPLAEITVRQVRATAPDAPAPFALEADVLGFAGSFLSLAMDLPREGATTLERQHIVGLSTRLRMERPARLFARLNVRQGPNTEQLVSELAPGERPDSPVTAEFDLGFHDIRPARLEHAWIDLIFDRPQMNLVRIDDLTVTRRPRADI